MRAKHLGNAAFKNEASKYVDEYIDRKRMAKLGIMTSIKDLPARKVDILLQIDAHIDVINNEKKARENKKRR